MKVCRVISKTLFFVCLLFAVFTFAALSYLNTNLSSKYKLSKGQKLNIDTALPVTAVYEGVKFSQTTLNGNIGESYNVDLKMFGVIPFSTVNVEIVDEMYVAVLGNPFGMKLYTEGVLVIDMTDFESGNQNINPAKSAGIKVGDYIVSVNGQKVYTNEDLMAVIEQSLGDEMTFKIIRNGKNKTIKLSAQKDATGNYKIGLWVRDSSAGIGTLTFYSPTSGVVCGLGHGISDEDTGEIIKINSGELVSAEIIGIQKGSSGSPGELKGRFTFDSLAGIALNSESGVYGFLKNKPSYSNLTEIALKQDVKEGYAQILCTINGEKPKLYSCTVKKRGNAFNSSTQNLMLTVTDSELLQKTGGIVQGMSGSPVLQNGRLIGAITHVLVDDPTTGYAIFAENMLETAQSVANENKLKDVS